MFHVKEAAIKSQDGLISSYSLSIPTVFYATSVAGQSEVSEDD